MQQNAHSFVQQVLLVNDLPKMLAWNQYLPRFKHFSEFTPKFTPEFIYPQIYHSRKMAPIKEKSMIIQN